MQLEKPKIKCKQNHREDQITMLPHKPVIKVTKPNQATQRSVSQGKNCQSPQFKWPEQSKSLMQLTQPVSVHQYKRLCHDKNCQSTRCFKKATGCLNTKIPEKSMCGDDKNCQSPKFIWPEKPNNAMQFKTASSVDKKNVI